MRYILYLPNPKVMTYEDSGNMDDLMKRVQASGTAEVEEAPAFFHIHEMLIQCKKYQTDQGDSGASK